MGLPRSTYYDAPAVKADDAEIVVAMRLPPNWSVWKADVRFWHKADIPTVVINVHFRG